MYGSVGYVRSFIYTVVLDFYKRSFKHSLTFEVSDANTVIVQKAKQGRFPHVASAYLHNLLLVYNNYIIFLCVEVCV